MLKDLYAKYRPQHEDFWHRRALEPEFSRTFRVNGCLVEMTSNHAGVLIVADLVAPQYSVAPPRPGAGFRLQIAVHAPPVDPGPPPEDLFPLIHYTGSGDWFNLHLGAWGTCFADLRAGFGVAILAPSLAARPVLVARHLINTLLTNFLTRNGFAMLHATGLVRVSSSMPSSSLSGVRTPNSRGFAKAKTAGRVLLLMAPHNSGKSTTALRLTLSRAFRLLTDSMVYLSETPDGLQLSGFPVGRGKLRRDSLPPFPELTPEQVRDETKFVLDLHQLDSTLVFDEAIVPDQIDLCLLKRNGQPKTFIQEATLDETWEAILLNSLHDDTPEVWAENLRLIEPLVNRARLFHLEIGTEGNGIVERILETCAEGSRSIGD
ncbi:MAG: hypothetical protein HUU38_25865 [Anaerolineales bacterium]|nr:hypothetical protein [Anaerolineales bacterium]